MKDRTHLDGLTLGKSSLDVLVGTIAQLDLHLILALSI